MNNLFCSGHSRSEKAEDIAAEIVNAVAEPPQAVVMFFSAARPGEAALRQLQKAWPNCHVWGCSTAGELSTNKVDCSSVAWAALGPELVGRVASSVADFSQGLQPGIAKALDEIESELGPLRALDPSRYLGLVAMDALHGIEEDTLVAIGNRAPLMTFLGASAGDDMAFKDTRVVAGERATSHGASLMVLELLRPFRFVRTNHLEATGVEHRVTRVDGRRLLEIDGRPAAEVYAEHTGIPPEQFSMDNLLASPIGLVIDGAPWPRQVVPPIQQDGAIYLGCTIAEGSVVRFMKPVTNLEQNLRAELEKTRHELGNIRGGILFDCVLRRLELEQHDITGDYAALLDFPLVGLSTYGESMLGHMHQTLTAVFFG